MHRRIDLYGAAAIALLVTGLSHAGDCPTAAGPDLIVGRIDQAVAYGVEDGIAAFSLGFSPCNVGSVEIDWQATTPLHPVAAQNLFRFEVVDDAGRFEQIGMSWLFHEFFALSTTLCCNQCEPTNGTTLGVGCSSSTSAFSAGDQSRLGPRSDVNAATGAFPFPPSDPSWAGTVARRLQVAMSDIDSGEHADAEYVLEVQFVAADDAAAGLSANNASWRPCRIAFGDVPHITLLDSTVRGAAAIEAWAAMDSGVTLSEAFVPADGRFVVASRATPLSNGRWHYEYAIENLDSHRAAREFSVPLTGDDLTAVGFHDVDYHSGDGVNGQNYDGTDWEASQTGSEIRWSTATFAENENANALRWGTLYNFRFESDRPPARGDVHLTLFRPGDPTQVPVTAQVPGCYEDLDGDGAVGLGDLSILLGNYGATDASREAGDIDGDGDVDLADLSMLLAAFGASCGT